LADTLNHRVGIIAGQRWFNVSHIERHFDELGLFAKMDRLCAGGR
jgi:hypothetical protein